MMSVVLVRWGFALFWGISMELKGKIMLHCLMEAKCQQAFTAEILF